MKVAHFKRIELSDAILVVNINHYIGNSTNREIEYAKKLGKEIRYVFDLKDGGRKRMKCEKCNVEMIDGSLYGKPRFIDIDHDIDKFYVVSRLARKLLF